MVTVCEWFGLKTTRTIFTGLASKLVVMVSGSFTSNLAATVSKGLASKPAVTVSGGLASQPAATVFSSLTSKLVAAVSPGLASKLVVGFLVEPQNQGGGGFPGLGLKTGSYGVVIWVSKSSRRFLGLGLKTKQASVCRLHHKTNGGRSARDTRRDLTICFTWEASLARVSQSGLKTGREATTGGARDSITEVASKASWRWTGDVMGCLGPYYHTFDILNVLGHRGIVVI
jgi:hypothetical protein